MVKKYFFMKNFLRYQIQFSESVIMNFQDHAAAYEELQIKGSLDRPAPLYIALGAIQWQFWERAN